jgi:hypothetical protein
MRSRDRDASAARHASWPLARRSSAHRFHVDGHRSPHPTNDLWLAWIGFNFSHSLGAVLFGLVVVLVGRSDVSFRAEAPYFGPLAMIVSGVYLVLAVKYWFRTPIVGCGLSFVLFLLSWALQLASG